MPKLNLFQKLTRNKTTWMTDIGVIVSIFPSWSRQILLHANEPPLVKEVINEVTVGFLSTLNYKCLIVNISRPFFSVLFFYFFQQTLKTLYTLVLFGVCKITSRHSIESSPLKSFISMETHLIWLSSQTRDRRNKFAFLGKSPMMGE